MRSIGRLVPTEAEGRGWLNADVVATGTLVAAVGLGAALPSLFGPAAAALSLVMFAAGCIVFFVAFVRGVERSRTEEVSVAGLYLLAGGVAPPAVKRLLLGLLAAEVVAAVAAASIRPFTSLAFGILAPVFGLSIVGRWAAEYGAFTARTVLRTKRAVNRRQRPVDEEGSPRA